MTGRLMADGKSHRVAEGARTALGKVLRAAEERGLVARNVARIARPPRDRGKARKVKAFTVAEVGQCPLAGLDDTRWHPITLVGVTTGLRPAELLALHWPDVTLGADARVSIRHAFTYVGGTALKAPKRARSYRTVPLAPEAVTALKAWRRTQAAERLAAGELWSTAWPGLVFTGPDGGPQRVDSFRHVLRRILPGAHPHRLRHSYATHLLEAGTPIHHVAELLGDSVATVERTYSHVLRTKTEVAGLASGLLGGAFVKPLVVLCCHSPGCRRPLARIWGRPDDWSATILVPPCPKHHQPKTPWRQGLWRGMTGVQPLGPRFFAVSVGLWLPLESLRPAVERAERTGKTVYETIRPQPVHHG